MKRTAILVVFALFALAASAAAQDWDKLERAADDVNDASEKLAEHAKDNFRKGGQNSPDAIEQAFLAEQTTAAAKYMKKIVGDKYQIGDLRLAANVLKELSEEFPTGASAEWGSVKDLIDSLVFELGRDVNSPPPETNTNVVTKPPDEDEGKILGRFFWNGEVDDVLQLAIRGTTLMHRTVKGRTMPDGSYSFTSALPRENGIVVGVKIVDGRGKATVIQQPNPTNDYSAIVRVTDDGGGARPYSLEIYWYKARN